MSLYSLSQQKFIEHLLRTERFSFNKETSIMKKQLCSRVVNETEYLPSKEGVIDTIWDLREAFGGSDH